MKKIILFGALSLVFFGCTNSPVEKEEEKIEVGESFGTAKINIDEAISVKEMLADYASKTSPKEYTFEGKINQVCTKAGCWVNIDKGNGEVFMVRFKDHFTIPVDTKLGSEAYLHGIAYWDTVTVEMLKHFAYDAGESEEEIEKIKEPKYELGFEADVITLKK